MSIISVFIQKFLALYASFSHVLFGAQVQLLTERMLRLLATPRWHLAVTSRHYLQP